VLLQQTSNVQLSTTERLLKRHATKKT